MYFMYVDESGDPGQWDAAKPAAQQGTSYFILTGFILPASEWRNYLSAMVEIRRQIKLKYGVPVRAELRGSTFIYPREVKIRRVLRRMRVYNPVPSMYQGYYHNPVLRVVEDAVIRKSQHSYFIQVADLIAHALYRKEHCKGSYRQFNIDRLFEAIRPLLLREASRSDMDGIVRL